LEETVEDFNRKRRRIDPVRNQPGLSFAFDEAAVVTCIRTGTRAEAECA